MSLKSPSKNLYTPSDVRTVPFFVQLSSDIFIPAVLRKVMPYDTLYSLCSSNRYLSLRREILYECVYESRYRYDICWPSALCAPQRFLDVFFSLFVLARDEVSLTGRNCVIAIADPDCVGGGLGHACAVLWLLAGRV